MRNKLKFFLACLLSIFLVFSGGLMFAENDGASWDSDDDYDSIPDSWGFNDDDYMNDDDWWDNVDPTGYDSFESMYDDWCSNHYWNGSETEMLTSRVNEAAGVLNEAISLFGESSAEASKAQAAYNQALEDLNNFIAENPSWTYTTSENNAVTTTNTLTGRSYGGEPTYGDPVDITSGEYVIEDRDLETVLFGQKFLVSRCYRSRIKSGGVFGKSWFSNLDMRILRCNYPDLSGTLNNYDSWISNIEQYKSYFDNFDYSSESSSDQIEIQGYADEFYSGYEKEISDWNSLFEMQEKSEKIKALKKYTNYGVPADFTDSLGADCLIFQNEDGGIVVFKKDGEAFYPLKQDFKYEKISVSEDISNGDVADREAGKIGTSGEFCLECKNGDKLFFDKFGLHLKTEFFNGFVLEKRWTFENEIITHLEIDLNGQNLYKIDFVNSSKTSQKNISDIRISEIKSVSNTIRYNYNSEERLCEIIEAASGFKTENFKSGTLEKKRLFEYNDSGLLTAQVFADGSRRSVSYSSNAPDAKVISVTDENSNSEYFSYDVSGKVTSHTDKDGYVSKLFYDENGNTVREELSDGEIIAFEYDEYNRPVSRSKTDCRELLFYNEDGKLVKILKSTASGENCVEYIYDGQNLKMLKKEDGSTLSFAYDSRGNMTEVYSGQTLVAASVYDRNNQIIEQTDYFGNRKSFTYDVRGNITEEKLFDNSQKLLQSKKYAYDSSGRLKNSYVSGGESFTFEYSGNKNFSVLSSQGLKIEVLFDIRGNVSKILKTDLFTGKKLDTEYIYDKARNLSEIKINGKTEYIYKYTKEGNLAKCILPETTENGFNYFETNFLYNSSKNLVSKIIESYCGLTQETEISKILSNDGAKTVINYEDGNSISVLRDGFGNLRKILSNGEALIERNYFNDGNIASLKNNFYGGSWIFNYTWGDTGADFQKIVSKEDGEFLTGILNAASNEYFPNGLLKRATDNAGISREYKYDGFGHVTETVTQKLTEKVIWESENRPAKIEFSDSQSGKILYIQKFTYGKWNSKEERWIKKETGENPEFTEKFFFDAFSNLVAKEDNRGNRTEYKYDDFGNCIETKFPSGVMITNAYNRKNEIVNQKISSIKNISSLETKISYDLNGNVTEISDKSGILYKSKYDRLGRILYESERPFSKFSAKNYEYDEIGRIRKIYLGDETVIESERKLLKQYFYETHSGGMKITIKDAAGNSSVILTDGFGRTISETNRLLFSQSFKYKSDGTFAEKIDFNGGKTKFDISKKTEDNAELIRTEFFDGEKDDIKINALGKIISISSENGSFSYDYDCAGFLRRVKDEKTGDVLDYSYNRTGKVTEISGKNYHVKYFYSDVSGFLTEVQDLISNNYVRFVYDDLGREILKIWSNGNSQKTEYDENGRKILTVAFDGRLSLLFMDGVVFDENGFSKLQLSSDGTITRYFYDDFGRVEKCLYSYSEETEDYMKSECDEAGLFFNENSFNCERLNLSSADRKALVSLLFNAGLNSDKLKTFENMLFEKFTYDQNGNIIRKENSFGTIIYSYDAENRLIKFGDKGKCTWDKNGNLLTESGKHISKSFSYNGINRMKTAVIENSLSDSNKIFHYFYDSLGRRIEETSSGSGIGKRNFYDGFSLRVLLTSPVIVNSRNRKTASASVSGNIGARSFPDNITESNGRYSSSFEKDSEITRFSEKTNSKKNNGSLKNKKSHSYTTGYSRSIFANDFSPVMSGFSGEFTGNNEIYSLISNLQGTVCRASSEQTQHNHSRTYSCFGSVFKDDFPDQLHIGFGSKDYNSDTSLYDFGYRDYRSDKAGFQTLDPIRDGENWYSYCGGNPLSFFDGDGLQVTPIIQPGIYMQNAKDEKGNSLTINGTSTLMENEGCVVTSMTILVNSLQGSNFTNSFFAKGENSVFYSESQTNEKTGDMLIADTAAKYGINTTLDTGYNAGQNQIIDALTKSANAETKSAVMVVVETGYGKHFGLANGTVLLTGSKAMELLEKEVSKNPINDEKQKTALEASKSFLTSQKDTSVTYVVFVGTSINDVSGGSRGRIAEGWIYLDNKVLVPSNKVERALVFEQNEKADFSQRTASWHNYWETKNN